MTTVFKNLILNHCFWHKLLEEYVQASAWRVRCFASRSIPHFKRLFWASLNESGRGWDSWSNFDGCQQERRCHLSGHFNRHMYRSSRICLWIIFEWTPWWSNDPPNHIMFRRVEVFGVIHEGYIWEKFVLMTFLYESRWHRCGQSVRKRRKPACSTG